MLAHLRAPIIWLPKYTAHGDDPVERLWGTTNGKIAANRLAGRIDIRVAQARRVLGDLAPHPVALPAVA